MPVTSQQLYSAGHTDDLRQALVFITYLFPDAPLVGLGFSLGANVIVRYLAEEKDMSRLSAACVLSCVSRTVAKGWTCFNYHTASHGTLRRTQRRTSFSFRCSTI